LHFSFADGIGAVVTSSAIGAIEPVAGIALAAGIVLAAVAQSTVGVAAKFPTGGVAGSGTGGRRSTTLSPMARLLE
jgi:hypothetical protein